jgi:hypothetical protein
LLHAAALGAARPALPQHRPLAAGPADRGRRPAAPCAGSTMGRVVCPSYGYAAVAEGAVRHLRQGGTLA